LDISFPRYHLGEQRAARNNGCRKDSGIRILALIPSWFKINFSLTLIHSDSIVKSHDTGERRQEAGDRR
jgi:hypothetical protein